MRGVQTGGVRSAADGGAASTADAVVVALKSRTTPAAEAVADALAALRWLQAGGARQILFKYCSTFDSTPAGNIGPVAEALMDALGTDLAVATPAFPDNGRTVYMGHLFVGDRLLHESGMQHHPLTPMRDPDLVRVLQAQSRRRVGLLDQRSVAAGPEAIRARLAALRAQGVGLVIADAITNQDLLHLGAALAGVPLVTGGSGIAIGLPGQWGFVANEQAAALPAARGLRAVVSGSCSAATRGQVAAFLAAGGAAMTIDPLRLAAGEDVVGQALAWAATRLAAGPVLVYATAEPAEVQAVQQRLGVAEAGQHVEAALAAVSRGLVGLGVGQLVVAGGETSGACVQALGLTQLQIGPQIAPGVPWCHAACAQAPGGGLHLALKSGNFGGERFFLDAFDALR